MAGMQRNRSGQLNVLFAGVPNKPGGWNPNLGQTDLVLRRLDLFMMERKPFLVHRYTIRQLSEEISVPARHLSSIIHLRKGLNFSNYLNEQRIRYCEQVIRTAGSRKIHVRDLSIYCGFCSRNTFALTFKKFTGHTPSKYIRKRW